jgi:hypothetical protein
MYTSKVFLIICVTVSLELSLDIIRHNSRASSGKWSPSTYNKHTENFPK